MAMNQVTKAEMDLRRARSRENAAAGKDWRDRLAARDAEIDRKSAEQNEKARESYEAHLKVQCGGRFASAGGTEEEFERAWPGIRDEYLRQVALGNGPQSFVETILDGKRRSGVYAR